MAWVFGSALKEQHYYVSGGAELQKVVRMLSPSDVSCEGQYQKGNTEVANLAGQARLACYAVNISKLEG